MIQLLAQVISLSHHMTQILITLTIFILSHLNSFAQTNMSFTTADHYKTNAFDVAIFPAHYYSYTSEQRFTPTREEIDKAESILRKDLKILNKNLRNQYSTPVIHEQLNQYKRQYFGYIDEHGDRIVLINCFWAPNEALTENWLIHRIRVLDGGSYYWNVKFNLDKGQLFDLSINGEA